MLVEFGMAYHQTRNAYKRFPFLEEECPGFLDYLVSLEPRYPAAMALIPVGTLQSVYQAGHCPIAKDVLLNVSARLQEFQFYEAILKFMLGHLHYYSEYHQWPAHLKMTKRRAYRRELRCLGELKNKAVQHIQFTRRRPQDCTYFNDDFYPVEMPLTSALCPLEPQLRTGSPSGTKQSSPGLSLVAIA